MGKVKIEYYSEPADPSLADRPTLVFLHEGLGSAALWRDVPYLVRKTLGFPALLVYSRPGYGNSTPVEGNRPLNYMHDEALEVLPKVLESLGIANPVLIGHSDGASIALIYAGSRFPVSALVLLAPHVFVEDQSIAGIEAARDAYLSTDLPSRLGRYHVDPDLTFWGWNRAWLSPEFLTWDIREYLSGITSPTLLIQGDQDEYGTLAQLSAIEKGVKGEVERCVIKDSHHAPHFDHTAEVVDEIARFLNKRGLF